MQKYSLREAVPDLVSENLKKYPELMRKMLHYRGISETESAESFLNPSYENHVHDPFLLKDMDRAVERILKAVEKNERILIYSDYDADGIPAAVVMSDFFRMIGYENFEVYIPHRHNEGYGLHLEAIETFKDRINLIITLDCGIVDHDEVKHANDNGIDVIITDHHLPQESLPPAYAVINPKRVDCEYPYKMLCGAGVAFKLVQALLKSLERQGSGSSAPELSLRNGGCILPHARSIKSGQEKWLLDMVGLATLSDMVPLDGENRVFAHYGLKVLRKSRRPGFTKLLSIIKVNKNYLNEDDLGFMVTPRINAASRMGVPSDAFHLLSTNDENQADELAKHLDNINKERKILVGTTVKEIKKILKEREDHFRDRSLIAMGNPLWRPALLGLAANTIAEELGKPVFLWGKEDGKDIKGSCRAAGTTNLVKLMQAAAHLFKEFGGHSFSGGYAVHPEKVHMFEDGLIEAYEKIKEEKLPEEAVYVDAVLLLDDVNSGTYAQIEKFAPFGTGNPKPTFIFKNVKPTEIKMFGKAKEHLEISFLNSNNKKIKAIGFFTTPEDFSVGIKSNIPITLVASFEKSFFGAYPEIRLRIVDII